MSLGRCCVIHPREGSLNDHLNWSRKKGLNGSYWLGDDDMMPMGSHWHGNDDDGKEALTWGCWWGEDEGALLGRC